MNLLDPAGPGALEGNHGRLPWEQGFILEILQPQSLWLIDQSLDVQKPFIRINQWDSTVVPDEMIFVGGQRGLDQAVLIVSKSEAKSRLRDSRDTLGGSPL